MLIKNKKELEKLARKIIQEIKPPYILAFTGPLGVGKTTFIRALAKVLKIKEKIKSPTFLLIQEYKIPPNSKFKKKSLIHIDAYRLNLKQFKKIGIEEILKNRKESLIAIEWAEKLKKILPKKTTIIKMKYGKKPNQRLIEINYA